MRAIPRLARMAAALPGAVFLLLAVTADTQGQAQMPPPAVVVERISERPVGTNAEFLARVEAIQAVDVRARVQGFLESVAFREGQAVEAGDILFRIQREQYEAELAAARAQVARAVAALTEAKGTLDRNTELRKRGTVAQATLDTAIANHAMAEAELASARSAERTAELNLGYTEIQAPISGRIGRALITRGNVVGPDSGPLARIVQIDPIRIAFSLSEAEVVSWRQARTTETARTDAASYTFIVRLPNGTDHPHEGRIDFIDSEADPATGTIRARAVFPNPENLLVPGQNVTLRVAEKDPPSFPVVRQSAVLQDRQGRYVYVLGDNDTVARRPIETGERVGEGWAVTSGLEAGETVVIQGVQRLRPGLQVRPTQAPDSRS